MIVDVQASRKLPEGNCGTGNYRDGGRIRGCAAGPTRSSGYGGTPRAILAL